MRRIRGATRAEASRPRYTTGRGSTAEPTRDAWTSGTCRRCAEVVTGRGTPAIGLGAGVSDPAASDASELWERFPEESAAAFRAFCLYRDMAPSVRSVLAAYRVAGHPAAKTASGRWKIWTRQWQWRIRAEAFDEESLRTRSLAMRERNMQAQDELFSVARRYLGISLEKLKKMKPKDMDPRSLNGALATVANIMLRTSGDPSNRQQRDDYPDLD